MCLYVVVCSSPLLFTISQHVCIRILLNPSILTKPYESFMLILMSMNSHLGTCTIYFNLLISFFLNALEYSLGVFINIIGKRLSRFLKIFKNSHACLLAFSEIKFKNSNYSKIDLSIAIVFKIGMVYYQWSPCICICVDCLTSFNCIEIQSPELKLVLFHHIYIYMHLYQGIFFNFEVVDLHGKRRCFSSFAALCIIIKFTQLIYPPNNPMQTG